MSVEAAKFADALVSVETQPVEDQAAFIGVVDKQKRVETKIFLLNLGTQGEVY